MKQPKAKDENDRLLDGSLPDDPGADATPMVDNDLHKATVRLVDENVDPKTLPLPHDVHAEAQLLATLLWYGTNSPATLSVSDVHDLLDARDRFFSPVHQDIFEAMLTVHTSLLPTSVTNVNSRLVRWGKGHRSEGIYHLEKLKSAAVQTDRQALRGYAQTIRDAWARRQLVKLSEDINGLARSGRATSSSAIDQAHGGLIALAQQLSSESTYVSFGEVASNILRSASSGGTNALPTGLEDLDDLTGGWYPQEVTVIAARTSVGKSALATQFAFDAIATRPNEAVLYVSLEMPAKQFVARILAARAGVSLRKIRRNQVDAADALKLKSASEAMKATRVYFVDSQLQTVMSISSIASRLNAALMREGARLSLIVVDHIGLVKPSSKSTMKNREQQVAETSRGMKYLAQHHLCHVMALAQISRESEKQNSKSKIPQLFHIRESGSIEQDAENIIIVHRERDPNGKFKPNAPAILNVAKARNDGLGHIWCAFEEDRGRFTKWADSEQAKARAPGTAISRQYVDTTPEPPPGRFDDEDDSNPLTEGL